MSFDSHFHLSLLPSPREVLSELIRLNYRGESSACFPNCWALEEDLLKNVKEIRPAFGLHPQFAQVQQETFERLASFIERNREASVGECGLDKRFDGYALGGAQERAFRFQIGLAKRFNRRLVIHCVGDYKRLFDILKSEDGLSLEIFLHRFPGGKLFSLLPKEGNFYFGNPRNFFENSFENPRDFGGNSRNIEAIEVSRASWENSRALLLRFRTETDADEKFAAEKKSPKEIARAMLEEITRQEERFQKIGETL